MKRSAIEVKASGPTSLLVVKPSSFGDIIHTLPAVARLKEAWPEARLAWVVNPEWASLLEDNPSVDEIVIFPRGKFRGITGIPKFFAWCRREICPRKPEIAVDFQGLLRSAWIARASGAAYKAGLADAREGAALFYDDVVPLPTGQPHAVERYLALADGALRHYGFAYDDTQTKHLSFPLPEGDLLPSDAGQLPERYVLLHPFSRGDGKSLSIEQIILICRQAAPERVMLVGKAPEPLTESWPSNCVDLLNRTTLKQLIRLIRGAASVVTVDSGPSHLAAALNRPMIAIHTWSDPRAVGPYRGDAWIWKNGRLLQFRDLQEINDDFFTQDSRGLSSPDIAAISRLATSF